MKKFLTCLFTIPFLFFQSCSNYDELLFDNEEQITSSSEVKPTPRMASDGKYDVLGFSYDIVGDYLDIDNTKLIVVDIDAFVKDPKNKDRFYNPGPTKGTTEFYSGANAIDFLEDIKSKTVKGGDANLKILGASLSGNLKKTTETHTKKTLTSKYSYSRADVLKREKKLYLDIQGPSELMPYLSPAFIQNLEKLSPDQFVKNYGTHVLLDITIGGRLQFNYESTITTTGDYSQKKKIAESGAKFSIGSFGAGGTKHHEDETIKSLNTNNKSVKIDVEYYGGTNGGNSYVFNSSAGLVQHNFDQSKWEESVNDKNAALIAIGWEKAFPIYEFIADPIKKAQIKGAVERHILNAQVEMIDVVPVYRYHSGKVKNYYYGIEPNAKVALDRDWGTNDWTLGAAAPFYVYNKPHKDAVPVYRYHSGSTKNYYYGTEPNAQAELNSNWGTNDWTLGAIAFYVHNKPEEYTIPIYRYHSGNTKSYYYGTESNAEAELNRDWGTNDWILGAIAPFYVFK